jgi:hypothetical protein
MKNGLMNIKRNKGCKEYFFNKEGKFSTIESEIVFKCVAVNDKSAIKKFNNHLKNTR